MYTLAELISQNQRPDIRTDVIEIMRMSSYFLNTAQFKPIKSGQVRITRRNGYPTVGARALNGALTAESTGTFDNVFENLSVYNGYSTVDPAFIKFQNGSVLDAEAQCLNDLSIALAKKMEADI